MSRSVSSARKLFRIQGPLLGLIALMFLLFFAQVAFGYGWYENLMAVPGQIVESWQSLRSGDATAADFREMGTLLSSAFLHGSFEHIASNMLFLWIFAALISELLGWRWMFIIFFLTAVAASATHTMMNRDEFIPMLGASGAVMGFEGAYLGLAVRWKLPDPHIWPMSRPIPPGHLALLAVIGVAIDYLAIAQGQNLGIAYGAHVGGFTMGLFVASLVCPRPRAAYGPR